MCQLLTAEALVGGIGAWTERTGPRYLRLAEAITDLIARESTPPGCRLPPERELAQPLEISRGTVVAAYGALTERGTVVRRQGSGTRVAAEPPAAPTAPRHTYPQLGRFRVRPRRIDLAFGAPYVDDVAWHSGASRT